MDRCTLRLTLVHGFVTATVFASSVVANAQTIRYDDGFATGITNLRINNLCYDVEFVDGSYVSAFADAPPTFLNEPGTAHAAAKEIRDVLNATRRVPEINPSDNEVLWIPHDRVSRSDFQGAQVGHDESSDPWKVFPDVHASVSKDYVPWDYGVFEEGPSVIYAANTGFATGIHNLNIDGTCMDVRFADGSYSETYADQPPRYLGLELRANNASNKIMDILNAESNVPEINRSDNEVLWIPTDRSRPSFEAEQVGHDTSDANWKRFGDFQGTIAKDFEAWDFAVFDESLDCNRDGIVDINDMNCACALQDKSFGKGILNAIGSRPGDVNGDGKVGFVDFLKLSGNFGETGEYTDGDLDCDGTVGFSDFLIQSGNYGGIGVVTDLKVLSAVPEPAGLPLLAVAMPGILLVFRRKRSR